METFTHLYVELLETRGVANGNFSVVQVGLSQNFLPDFPTLSLAGVDVSPPSFELDAATPPLD